MAESFVENNVEVAHIWAVQHESAINLLGDEGQTELSVLGEMFRVLIKNSPGTRLVDLTNGFSNETEAKDRAVDVHLLYSYEKVVAYIASTSEHSSTNSFDFSSVITSTGAVTKTRIGVAQEQPPGANNSEDEISNVDPDTALIGAILELELVRFKIIEVIFDAPNFRQEFATISSKDSPIPDLPRDDDRTDDKPANADDLDLGASETGVYAIVGALLL